MPHWFQFKPIPRNLEFILAPLFTPHSHEIKTWYRATATQVADLPNHLLDQQVQVHQEKFQPQKSTSGTIPQRLWMYDAFTASRGTITAPMNVWRLHGVKRHHHGAYECKTPSRRQQAPSRRLWMHDASKASRGTITAPMNVWRLHGVTAPKFLFLLGVISIKKFQKMWCPIHFNEIDLKILISHSFQVKPIRMNLEIILRPLFTPHSHELKTSCIALGLQGLCQARCELPSIAITERGKGSERWTWDKTKWRNDSMIPRWHCAFISFHVCFSFHSCPSCCTATWLDLRRWPAWVIDSLVQVDTHTRCFPTYFGGSIAETPRGIWCFLVCPAPPAKMKLLKKTF